MPVFKFLNALAIVCIAVMAAAGTAWAGLGQPSPWQIGLQESATPVMDNIIWFHDFLLYIVTGIAGFVLVLLVVVMMAVYLAAATVIFASDGRPIFPARMSIPFP